MVRKIIIACIGASLLMLGALAPSSATDEGQPDCKTVSTQLVDRPDSAVGGGTWALDQLERTVEICRVPIDSTEYDRYDATLVDTGTFRTLELDHTPAGVDQPLPASIKGDVHGGVQYSVVAAKNWGNFDASHLDGKTIKKNHDDYPTSEWVKSMFEFVHEQDKELYGSTWSWTYTTCGEQWINQAKALGGNSGDITGKPCVTPEAPKLTHPVCKDPGTVTIPEVKHVSYKLQRGDSTESAEQVEPGDYDVEHGEYVQVIATLDEGYVLPFETQNYWVLRPVAKGCPGDDGEDGADGEDGEVVVKLPTRIDTGR